jgi:transposase-like protein
MVAAAVELAGRVTAVAKLCGVARQSVYTWIDEWRVERLVDALKLARASGIPVERLAGEAFKPEKIPAATSVHESEEDPE